MGNEFLDYVEDILDAMEKAEMMLEDVEFQEFVDDFRINFVVVRALEIIGEATKRLPLSLREQYPAIPWKQMAGMRDRIIHGYDAIDYQVVWDAVKQEIPPVKPHLQQILSDYEAQADD
jgi:uncharacterized protein with HEPN domain